MKKFLFNVLCMVSLVVAAFLLVLCGRVIGARHNLRRSLSLEPGQKFLFMGDSHIGCTFVESQSYANHIVWVASLPPQFSLMRLREMDKSGVLKQVECLVLEIGLQSFGQQRVERMKESWMRMLPLAWRHYGVVPLSVWNCLSCLIMRPSERFMLNEPLPVCDIPITARSESEKQLDLMNISKLHFGWVKSDEQMCYGWDRSLKEAIVEIDEICNRNHVRLVFFTAPVTSYYMQAIPSDVEKKLQDYIQFLSKLGIDYYDLRQWGQDSDFQDCFHFTHKAAERFTDWFYRQVVR